MGRLVSRRRETSTAFKTGDVLNITKNAKHWRGSTKES